MEIYGYLMMANKTTACVFVDTGSFDSGDIHWPADWQGLDVTCYEQTPATELLERARGAAIIVTNKVVLDRDTLQQLPELKLVCIAATGTNNVDLTAATELGICVCNVTAYATASVVEHVFGLILGLMRRLNRYHRLATDGRWSASDQFCVLDEPLGQLQDRVLGIIGYGELGRHVARVAGAFGMRVLIAERKQAPVTRAGRVSFEAMLAEADIVSLHCPLNDETRNLFGQHEFQAMKQGAMLVNTARGGVVDEQALLQALVNGDIAAAALDVLAQEPPPADHPLFSYSGDNLLITPHVAWASTPARQNLLDGVIGDIRAWQSGDAINVVSG